jgi:3-hydroxyisobutyrate dehydrogenase-like beta-hydroxyacid dehydrogenase
MKLGFIGLGHLGMPIAANLLESGYELYVYNRTLTKAVPLKAKGAMVCESIAALTKSCNIIFSIVSDDAALKSICEGEGGLLQNLAAGGIHVSMSTILPETAKSLAEAHHRHQQQYLASPVFGRPEAAKAKTLNYVVSGGEAALRKQMEPLLKGAGATGVWDFGDTITAANTVKLCGNFLIASALEAIGESVQLANKSGVDANAMWDIFLQTLFNAPVYHSYSGVFLRQQFEPAGFSARLGLKDMNLVAEQAASVQQTMPLGALLQHNMQQLVDHGKGDMDWCAVSLGANLK